LSLGGIQQFAFTIEGFVYYNQILKIKSGKEIEFCEAQMLDIILWHWFPIDLNSSY